MGLAHPIIKQLRAIHGANGALYAGLTLLPARDDYRDCLPLLRKPVRHGVRLL